MPDVVITLSTGTITRIQAAAAGAGYPDAKSWTRELMRVAVVAFERGNAAATAIFNSEKAVTLDFASTST